MKIIIKSICCLLFALATYSCNGPEKTKLPKDNISEPATISRQQILLDVPWIDPALLPVNTGC